MIGDPLILAEKDFKDGEFISSQMKHNKIVLIGGGSGTKKSEKALALQQFLFCDKQSSLVISLDDHYLVHPTVRNYNRKKQGINSVGIKEIDWIELESIYCSFKSKDQEMISFSRTHRFLDASEYVCISNKNIDVLIIEGLYANYLRKMFSDNFSVFLEGTPQQTLSFRQLRGKESPDDKFRQQVVQKEFNVVSQLRKYADLIIPFETVNCIK
ncbi:MAG: hypothetical protein M0R03_16965 [Novosphingobium sp.]|nr:hypothetical protein [Novosphingobium sp.]